VAADDATLTLRPALEFWPLVGDVASQERAGARIVDASTQRWELSLDGSGPDRIAVAGLPVDEVDALARRQERITVSTTTGDVAATGHWTEMRPFTVDLRASDGSRT